MASERHRFFKKLDRLLVRDGSGYRCLHAAVPQLPLDPARVSGAPVAVGTFASRRVFAAAMGVVRAALSDGSRDTNESPRAARSRQRAWYTTLVAVTRYIKERPRLSGVHGVPALLGAASVFSEYVSLQRALANESTVRSSLLLMLHASSG